MRLFSDIKKRISEYWADDAHFIPRCVRDWLYNRVGLYTLDYDANTEYYYLDYRHIKRADLPLKAVHVTGAGESKYYLDNVDTGEYPKPLYMTATDLYLYMVNNDISDALTNKGKIPIIMDTKTGGLIIVCVVVLAAFVAYKFLGA